MSTNKVALPGSERHPLGVRVGEQPADETVEVSIILKPKSRAAAPHSGGTHLSREAFAASHGADETVIEKIKQLAAENNLTVVEASAERRTVRVEGTAANMTKAFETVLARYEHDGQEFRGRVGAIKVPEDLAPSIEAVLGLDNRPQAKPHYRVRSAASPTPAGSFTPRQVAALYQFPLDVTGAGETIAILELGGGYKTADLKNFFKKDNIAEPTVTAVLVDKGKNAPTTASSADGEVLLDIEVAGSVAPGAKIVVYFAPNTTDGFQDALTTAIHDKTNKPSVISISWGGAESTWTSQSMTAFDSAAQDAAALGVTICVASGDNGSTDGETDGANHVDFPASSPNVLACGGTSLVQGAGLTIQSEVAWNDGAKGGSTGGGFSTQFARPAYQAKINTTTAAGRGVPDVSGDADPETGYQVLVDGDAMVIGGTSAVAPLWSGLIALLNQKLGSPVGFLQPVLYALSSASGALHDITQGNNGAFTAAKGWDPVTGLGSPSGENLLKALKTSTVSSSGSKAHSARA